MLVFRTKCHDHFYWCFLWDAGAGSLIRGQLLKGTEAPERVAPSLEFGGVGSPLFTVVYTTIPNTTESGFEWSKSEACDWQLLDWATYSTKMGS